MMGIYDLDLQELPLFEGLKADEVEQFIQATGAKVKRYGKEVRILKAYETNSRIGIIVEGEALVIAEDRFGNETVGHRLERGALFGSTTAILPEYASPTAIEAVSDVLVLWVDVTKRFAGRTVIGHLSAELTGGTVTAVTGANGSGKSTLLKMAAKLLLPDEGKIVARDGRQELSKAAYRARIGIVTPEFHAYPKLTARENLDFFLGFRRAAPLSSVQYERMLARVGLASDQVAGKFVEPFSTGMKKRLHLAILLAVQADIWLLDEPGANLDAAGRSMVRREARRAAAAGKLVLLATNDREEEAVADACISLSGH